jgi:hypothetical protein
LLYGFLTTVPNGVVGPIHPKAMPVILTTREEHDGARHGMKPPSCNGPCPIPCSGRRQRRAQGPSFRGDTITTITSALMDLVQAVVSLAESRRPNMNWIKCTDMNKQPIFVNIENATSIFWIEKEKSSVEADQSRSIFHPRFDSIF